MYKEFFKLIKLPFENVNDTSFFFESENHKEAYSRISFVIEEKKSCALLTGGYGVGKTFLLKTIEKNLSKKGYIFSVLHNSRLDDIGFLRMILHNFTGYNVPKAKEDVLMGLEKFLKDTYRDGKHSVIVIDEAQNIEDENVFEELRTLLNYQNENRSLLTLILSGQTEFSEKLYSNKQFSQRVFLSYTLNPFTFEETISYIRHRLNLAGLKEDIFDDKSYEFIFERSGGIPRWINNICNMSLITAFSKGVKKINLDIINEAVESMRA